MFPDPNHLGFEAPLGTVLMPASGPGDYSCLLSEEDTEFVRWKWQAREDNRNVYLRRTYTIRKPCGNWGKKTLLLHRAILRAPEGLVVDHINGVFLPGHPRILDNRRSNLRLCSRRENSRGFRHKMLGATSRFRGVSKSGDKWVSILSMSKTFASEAAAADWYAEHSPRFHAFVKEVA